MSTQEPAPLRAPRPIFGILAPGEKRTRKFTVLPAGVMPLVQNFPGGSIALAGMGKDFVTVENRGPTSRGFAVLFVTQDHMQKLMLAKQAVGIVAELRKKTQ